MKRIAAVLVALGLCASSAPALAVNAGEWAPDFEAASLNGGPAVRLGDHHGKVVYLDFWASWCASCRVSLGLMEQLRHEFQASGFEVIAVNVDEDPADGVKALKNVPIGYLVAADPKGDVAKRYDVPAMPSTYLIGRDGAVRSIHKGFKEGDFAEIRESVRALVGEN
jgi:peroxiredoxin